MVFHSSLACLRFFSPQSIISWTVDSNACPLSVRLYFTLNGFLLTTFLFTMSFSSRSSRLSESTFDDTPPTSSFSSLNPEAPDSSSLWIITGCHFLDIMFAVAVSAHQFSPEHSTGIFSLSVITIV